VTIEAGLAASLLSYLRNTAIGLTVLLVCGDEINNLKYSECVDDEQSDIPALLLEPGGSP